MERYSLLQSAKLILNGQLLGRYDCWICNGYGYSGEISNIKKMAQLFGPMGIFVSNDEVFICDTDNNRVRKLLRNGQIVTICGTGVRGYNGDGILATEAALCNPRSVVVSSSNQVYIAERYNRIRKIDQFGVIHTIAGTGDMGYNGDDQLAITAQLNYPCGLFVTEDEEILIADTDNDLIRKIDRNGMISTVAGYVGKQKTTNDEQLATSTSLNGPSSVFQYKNEIYIADSYNHRIRKIDRHGKISTIAGTGVGEFSNDGVLATETDLYHPNSVFVHNDQVYFSEAGAFVKKILPNGIVKTIAGKEFNEEELIGVEKLATKTNLNDACGLFVDSNSRVYISDYGDHWIGMIDENGMMKVLIGASGDNGYSGDVSFDFKQYPHIGPRKKQLIKPFPNAYLDLIVNCLD